MDNIDKSTANLSSGCYFSSDNDDFMGFKEDVEQIIKKLTTARKECDVISIVGMAGLGKTTLAKKVYNNHSIAGHFDVHIFCTISQTYSVRQLLAEILKQATGEKVKDDEDDVAVMLKKALYSKRYLIVLDDLWIVLKTYCGILKNTRNGDVAHYMNRFSEHYSLPFLNGEKSWECSTISCSLIFSMAGILSSKKREASLWLEVAHGISSHAFEMETSMKTIQSSYDLLPNNLKPCLLYIGLFPNNYEIPLSDLLEWWIAEEFVLKSLPTLLNYH